MQLSLLLLEPHMDLETDQLHLTYQIYKVNLLRERVVILMALVIVLEAEGGENFVTLTTSQIPSHKHDTNIDGGHVMLQVMVDQLSHMEVLVLIHLLSSV